MDTALREHSQISEIHSLARVALLWFLHPNFRSESLQYYESLLTGLFYGIEHPAFLKKICEAIRYYKTSICQSDNSNKPVEFCTLYQTLVDLKIYAITLAEKPMSKILNPASHYKKILELSTMRSIQTDIAALEIGQENLEQTLYNMRSSLGDHFYQLATFDQDKAEYDVGFLQDKISDFSDRIANTNIKDEMQKILYYAIGSNTAEMAQLTTQLAGVLAENMNPLKWLTGGGGIQDVLDQANALAKAGVDTAKLIAIHEELFPAIGRKADALAQALAANARVHHKLNVTFHGLKDKESIDIDTVQSNFLIDYQGYDPGWSKGDIAEYTVLLNGVIDELCDVLYSGGTAASAVVQMVGASKSICLRTKVKAEILQAVYEEMYDFQYDFMEAMATAVRALVTKHSANAVRTIPREAGDPEQYRVFLKFYVFRMKFQSKQHVMLALKEVCDVDEYKNGGVQTELCERALESQMFSDIDRVIADQVDECPSDQTSEFFVRFPARLNPDKNILEPGVLDLTAIYAGELTSFKIPYTSLTNWVQRHVSYAIPSQADIALYVNRFEIFLPDMTDNAIYDVTVKIKQDGLKSVSPGGGVKYGFSDPKVFNLIYGENKRRCVNGFHQSPYPELCPPNPSDVCVASPGVVSENELAPPLYSNWLIQFILPHGLVLPKPTAEAPFYLWGVLSICHKNPKGVDLSDLPRPNVANVSVGQDRCCPDQQYWYMSERSANVQGCFECPRGSFPKLGGLYCHVRSSLLKVGHRQKKSFKHGYHPHRKQNRQHKKKGFLNHAIKHPKLRRKLKRL